MQLRRVLSPLALSVTDKLLNADLQSDFACRLASCHYFTCFVAHTGEMQRFYSQRRRCRVLRASHKLSLLSLARLTSHNAAQREFGARFCDNTLVHVDVVAVATVYTRLYP